MSHPRVVIREAAERDRDAVGTIFHAVVSAGESYPFDRAASREEGLDYWYDARNRVFVAEADGVVLGSYVLRANWPGPGSHIANAAFIVSPDARGGGVGRALGEHALAEARRLGFRAMQFNFVVSTNAPAVRLWLRLGFRIAGTLPGAFRHPERGDVDVYVMFRELEHQGEP